MSDKSVTRLPSFFSLDSNNTFATDGIIIAGFPYDCTASYRSGARFAPKAIRAFAADGLETFSFYFGEDLLDIKVCDAGDMPPLFGDPAVMIEQYKKAASSLITEGGQLLAVGGEHLITYPLFMAAREVFGDFTMLHLDAHADLACELFGARFSHGTVMDLCLEAGLDNLIQFGIRSGDREEYWKRRNDPRIVPAGSLEELEDSIEDGEKIYLSLDLDFFDPGFFPGTGTPEAGGADFNQFISILRLLRKKKVKLIGADMVELAPDLDSSGNSTVFAAKIMRELLLTMNALRDS